MDINKARKILESDNINRVYENDFAKGVAIIAKYGGKDYSFGHEQIWFGDFESTVEQMSEEEVKQLASFGWFEDEDAWSKYS
jgi:hypothetical protein